MSAIKMPGSILLLYALCQVLGTYLRLKTFFYLYPLGSDILFGCLGKAGGGTPAPTN